MRRHPAPSLCPGAFLPVPAVSERYNLRNWPHRDVEVALAHQIPEMTVRTDEILRVRRRAHILAKVIAGLTAGPCRRRLLLADKAETVLRQIPLRKGSHRRVDVDCRCSRIDVIAAPVDRRDRRRA